MYQLEEYLSGSNKPIFNTLLKDNVATDRTIETMFLPLVDAIYHKDGFIRLIADFEPHEIEVRMTIEDLEELLKRAKACKEKLEQSDNPELLQQGGKMKEKIKEIRSVLWDNRELVKSDIGYVSEKIYDLFPKWISVDERLPEVNKRILATDGGVIKNCIYMSTGVGTYWWWIDDRDATEWGPGELENVTHWMPLPDLPQLPEGE